VVSTDAAAPDRRRELATVDRNGVVWMPLDSGHIGSFDRRKCKGPLNGPDAEKGEKCPEGFAFYPIPGPGFQGDPGAEECPLLHLGRPARHIGSRRQCANRYRQPVGFTHALVGGQIIELRVPYPISFFAKGLEGRIDDPNAG